MTHEEERACVERARAGDTRALVKLIRLVVDHHESGTRLSDVESYASNMARSLRWWDAEDLVSMMQEIVWRLVMQPEGEIGYDPTRGRLGAVAWKCLRRRALNLLRYEGRMCRKGARSINEYEGETLYATGTSWGTSWGPWVDVIDRARREPDGLSLEFAVDLDRAADDLANPAKLCLSLVIAGYEVDEIARIMSTDGRQWSKRKIRSLLCGDVRRALKPIREGLEV